ncbi:MAG TPA: hypothetical protein VKU02_34160 [Gemmataceae bacterium]|nr:hypothetical protein [Gemmataceae bacterium]
MKFWTRELAGWILLGLGLYVFYRDFQLLMDGNHWIMEGGMLTVIGIFLFRGGIQLLKIAVAARVCMEAQDRLERDHSKPGRTLGFPRPMLGRRPVPYAERSTGPS